MNPKLPVVTASQAVRVLHRDGWYDDHQRGSHLFLSHPTKQGRVTVPMHKGKDLPSGTLARILTDAGLTIEEFRRLL